MRFLTYATAAFGALVALIGGVWWWICRDTDSAVHDGFTTITWEHP